MNQRPFNKYPEKLKIKIFFLSATLFLSLLMGVRSIDVGTDTCSYYNHYNIISYGNNFDLVKLHHSLDFEYGYIIYMKVVSLIFKDYVFFQIISSIIICGLLFRFLYLESNYPLLSLLIILPETYLLGYNIQRQILATVIVLTAFTFYQQNKNFKSILLLIVAFSIHTTTIFSIPIFILYKLRRFKSLVKIEPVLLIGFIFLFEIFLSMIPYIETYANYMDNHKVKQVVGSIKYLWAFESMVLIFMIYSNKYSNILKIFSVFGLIYITAQICGMQFNYFERLGTYYYPFLAISIPNILNGDKIHIRLIGETIIGLFFFLYFTISVGGQYEYGIY